MIRKMLSLGAGLAVMAGIVLGVQSAPAHAANPKLEFAMPNLGLTFSYAYIAQAAGYWKDAGVDVDLSIIDGSGAAKAMMAGDIQFAGSSGVNILLSTAAHQPAIAIANPHNQLILELVLSKAAAAKTGLDLKTATVAQKAAAIKGMTIASDGPNTILDAFLKHIAVVGGLNPEKDLTTTYLQPPAAAGALKTDKIDGMSMLPPFTTIAGQDGSGVIWISAARGDLPDLNPFAYTTISALKPYCEANADNCRKFLSGVKKAFDLMENDPDKGLELIAPTYKGMDPALLKVGYMQQRALLNPTGQMTEKQFKITQDFVIGAGILKPDQARASFEGVAYTNAYWK